jgi:hypothetical protein
MLSKLKIEILCNFIKMEKMSDRDNFDYLLPKKYSYNNILTVITYELHDARIISKKLRSQLYPEMDLSIMEADIKKNDILFLKCEITYEEYLKKYKSLLNFEKKTKIENLEYFEKMHLTLIDEYKMMLSFLNPES